MIVNRKPILILSDVGYFSCNMVKMGYIIGGDSKGKCSIYSSNSFDVLYSFHFEYSRNLYLAPLLIDGVIYVKYNNCLDRLDLTDFTLHRLYETKEGGNPILWRGGIISYNLISEKTKTYSVEERMLHLSTPNEISIIDGYSFIYVDSEYIIMEKRDDGQQILECRIGILSENVIWTLPIGCSFGAARFSCRLESTLILNMNKEWGKETYLICIDLKKGKILWEIDHCFQHYQLYNDKLVGCHDTELHFIDPILGVKTSTHIIESYKHAFMMSPRSDIAGDRFYVSTNEAILCMDLTSLKCLYVLNVLTQNPNASFIDRPCYHNGRIFINVGHEMSMNIFDVSDLDISFVG